jgi:endonuclease/exonuclease/phosphatase family metal-dependent hydrolase
VPPALVDAIVELDADILVFNEYVDQGAARNLKEMLVQVGFDHHAVSDSVEYSPGRWHNQVLIASTKSIDGESVPLDGPDCMCRTNTLSVTTHGIRITGIRAPAYTRAAEWYAYWEWANEALGGGLVIGDFNADPGRPRKWDRVLATLETCGGWTRPDIDGEWSYRGNNGSTSRVDHVLVRNGVSVSSARYVPEPFVPTHTDHAALLVEVGE